jgi:hypothetical protein
MKCFLSRVSRRPRLADCGKTIKPDAKRLRGRAITLLQRFFADFCSLRVGGLQPGNLEVIGPGQRLDCGQGGLNEDQVGQDDCAAGCKDFN